VALAVVHDLREVRAPAGPDELAAFETDTLAGLVLARAAAGLADSTIAGEVIHLDQVRAWLGRPLWTMQPADADAYFGQVLRGAAGGTRLARAQALKTYFLFLELRHKAEIHQMTGHVVACPVDEVNRPRGSRDAALRIPPSQAQVGTLFAGWRGELAECRKFAPAARNYAAAKLMAEVGLRVNEACQLDLDDVKWDLGRFGKIHVRMGKGARGSGPRERMVPLINNARATLEWFVQDVWGHFDDDHTRPGAPLLPSERRNPDGTCARVGDEAPRAALAGAAAAHLPDWRGRVTPHLLRHSCASQLHANGMDLTADPGGPGSFLGHHHHELHPRPPHPCRGRLDLRPAARRREAEGAADMTAGVPAAGPGQALTGLDRASIAAAARAVLHAGGHRGATLTGPPGIPPDLRRRSER
jgi:integrase/recombinase XerD